MVSIACLSLLHMKSELIVLVTWAMLRDTVVEFRYEMIF